MDLNIETIESLVDLAIEKNLSELTVEQSEQKVTIKTGFAVAAVSTIQAVGVESPVASVSAQPQTTPAQVAEESVRHYYKVTSPMVGTFYKAPSPDSPAFAEVGTSVSKGQTLCIIEAMKLMNELESEVSGVVRKICVENGAPVEFGQVLMEVEVQ